jgi:RNA polymerase sigma-70 factor (ECF subfamily)
MHISEPVNDFRADGLNELLERGFRYSLSLTHDRSDAEDLIQDAVTTMLTKGCGWQRSYLFATIRNRYIDGYRRKQVLKFESLKSEADMGGLESSARLDPLDVFEAAHVRGALGTLRKEEREALFLAVVEGYTAEEIARRTERSRGTVLSLIFRAKRKLRESLTARCQPSGSASLALDAA